MPSYVFFNSKKGGYYGVYTDKSGKRKQFSCKTKDKRKAEIFYQDTLKKRWQAENEEKLKVMAFSDFIEHYLQVRQGEEISVSQLKALRSSLQEFNRFLRSGTTLSEITVEDCETFITVGPGRKWPSLWTSRRHYQNLTAIFAKALSWGYVKSNPFTKFKKPSPRQLTPDILSVTELEVLKSDIPEHEYHNRRLKRICSVAFLTGLRLTELRYLEIADLDFDDSIISIRIKANFIPKGKKPRVVPMTALLKDTLIAQIEDNKLQNNRIASSTYVFPNGAGLPLSKEAITHPFKATIVTRFPDRRKLRFHSLRHSFGSLLAEKGVPLQEIQKIMGHSSVKVTEIYARMRSTEFTASRKVLEQLNLN